ncbi:carboxypeptidase-like regulatory domain-containing protein [Myroides sp. DW712]|uniref:carboxypeptidase-like regulatory domain-containing protein n=1 Tax=Myroides sp. DW712 TaxID=3389800 RepID=UPI00397A5EF0
MPKNLLFYVLLFIPFGVQAQLLYEIKGRVIDAKLHTPVQGVVLHLEGTMYTALTDDQGLFSIPSIPSGSYKIVFSFPGFITKYVAVETGVEQTIDMGHVFFEKDFERELNLGIIALHEQDLEEDDGSTDASFGLLQATRDPFSQAAAFNWGQAFYRVRGLDSEYSTVAVQGLVMNKTYDGRPQWANWGGLNDAMKNQTVSLGSMTAPVNFGRILGVQAIETRASHTRKKKRIGFSGSTTNYKWRPYFIYASGLNKKGWAYTFSGSYRGAKEGYTPGTNYDALSLFTAVEKKIDEQHSVNFSAIYARNKRGKTAPVTDEYVALKGMNYNSYWGWQEDKKRNARYKEVEEPLFLLNHHWTISEYSALTTTIGYQFGHLSTSRLGYQDNLNPDPTYYKFLPSYFFSKIAPKYWAMTPEEFNQLPHDDPFKESTQALLNQAEQTRQSFVEGGQVDWETIYRINQSGKKQSKIVLYEDRQQDQALLFHSSFHTRLNDKLQFTIGTNYRKIKSTNYKKIVDLLGGEFYLDVDTFLPHELQDSDLNTPQRIVGKGGRFGYNYDVLTQVVDVFSQVIGEYRSLTFYLAQNIGYATYQREGHYRNPMYDANSLGKSALVDWNNFGFKGGLTYYITGKHAFSLTMAYYTQVPYGKLVFANVRMNNTLTAGLKNEGVFSIDGSYMLRSPRFNIRLSGYLVEIKNGTQMNFYYADGIGITDPSGQLLNSTGGAFVSETLTNVGKRTIGIELGGAYQLSATIKVNVAAGIGTAYYTQNPAIQLNADQATKSFDFGKAYLKNYRLSNGPQTAFSLGLEYSDPKFWFIAANINYLADAYVAISALKRTANFVEDPDAMGQVFSDLTEEKLRRSLRQEKLNPMTLFNLFGGKSWRFPNRTIIGFFASINNVLNLKFKTGGFEQARNANYAQEMARTQSGHPVFGTKYWYGYGRTFFVTMYYNF